MKVIFTDLEKQLESSLGNYLLNKLGCDTYYQSKFEPPNDFELLYWYLIHRLENELGVRFNYYDHDINPYNIDPILPQVWVAQASWLDFCISEGQYDFGFQRQESIFLSLIKYCGWIFPFENICIVCDRPIKLSFDNQNRLHAEEGEPAIRYADGYSLYSYHGVMLPGKYAKLHPHQWQAKWLLEEDDAELRRVLIQGIGCAKICQELSATEMDSWQEYILLKIHISVDVEPVYLLKMTDPSTEFIRAEEVPPDIQSAREASYLVGWELDPEESGIEF